MLQPSLPAISGNGKVIFSVPFVMRSGKIKAEIFLSTTLDFKSLVPAAPSQTFDESWIGNPVVSLCSSYDASTFAASVNNEVYTIRLDSAASPSTYIVTKGALPASTGLKGPIACSTDGKVIAVATGWTVMNSGVFLSSDAGATFTLLASYPTSMVCAITGLDMSADGSIIASYCPNVLAISIDGGSSWQTKSVKGGNAGGSLTMSANAGIIAIALQSGAVLISTDHGNSFAPRGIVVPAPTAYPSALPTSRPTQPTPVPTTSYPTVTPSSTPTVKPTPFPSSPSALPTTAPTAPTPVPTTGLPSTPPTPPPTSKCVCPYSFTGSASANVCQQCVTAAPCCTYCPTQPAALCQTTSSSSQCPSSVVTTAGCSASGGGNGGEGSGGAGEAGSSTSTAISVSANSSMAIKVGVPVAAVLFLLCSFAAFMRWRRSRLMTQGAGILVQPTGPPQMYYGNQHSAHLSQSAITDSIPAPVGSEVGNPMTFGSTGRLDPSAPYSNM